MIKFIKNLLNIDNDCVYEINNILINNPNSKLGFELPNRSIIKVTILNINYNIYYEISGKEFLKVLNNLIIKSEITLLLIFVNVYHKEISDFIKKNKIENISLENFIFSDLVKLQLNNIKNLSIKLGFTNNNLFDIMKYINQMQYLEYFYCVYRSTHLKEIIQILKYNKQIKNLHLINIDSIINIDIYEEVYKKEYQELFLNNNALVSFKSNCGLISNETYNEIFNILKYNKTLQSYTSLNENWIFDIKSLNNLKIYNDTLNTIIINKQKFTNDNNLIKLNFNYFDINFIYL